MDWSLTPSGYDVSMPGKPNLVYAAHLVTDAAGAWTGQLPEDWRWRCNHAHQASSLTPSS